MNPKESIAKIHQMVNMNRFKDACDLAIALVGSEPNNVVYWRMRGDLHLKLGEFDQAIECINRIIQLTFPLNRSATIDLYRVLGTTYYKLRRPSEAIDALNRVIAVDPDNADARTLRAMCYSLLGDFERGWPDYEYRRHLKFFSTEPRKVPTWDGTSLKEKTIIVHAEQGHGDTIQFVRYLPQVKALGATVLFSSQPLLTRLLSGCAGADRVFSAGELVPFHHAEIPLMSLMRIFRTTLDTIPGAVPYLWAPTNAGEKAKQTIACYKNNLRVGLVWKGQTQKSLTLHHLSEVLNNERVRFFSLQKGETAAELESISSDNLVDLGSCLEDFADTAAAMQELDLIISVDTSAAHLAGALAKPAWTLLPFVPDWRWMLDREDSPWYPTMRLFRQPAPGDWDSVIWRVAEELKSLVRTR